MNKDYDEFDMWCKNRLTKNDIYSAIFEGMTNGEVLEEVFGSNFYPPLVFCADWYKEPYKGEQE